MERFETDTETIKLCKVIAKEKRVLPNERMLFHARFILACADIGEPPLRDRIKDVPFWAQMRLLEQSEDIGPHRSSVEIVQSNPELWELRTREELEEGMRRVLTHIQEESAKITWVPT